MPQRPRSRIIEPFEVRPHDDVHPQDCRALERIRFHFSDWDRMNWYAELIKKDLGKMTPGEVLALQEEFRALKRILWLPFGKGSQFSLLPPVAEMKATQSLVAKHLQELADKGETTLGPFQLKTHVISPAHAFRDRYKGMEPSALRQLAGVDHKTDLLSGNGLVYYLAELLKTFGGSIRRCPHCSTIFLQFRRNAQYCGRKCQSVAVMRKKRSVAKAKPRARRLRAKKQSFEKKKSAAKKVRA